MRTDDLIAGLVEQATPVGKRSSGRDLALLAALGGVELVLYLLSGALRPDLGAAMAQPFLWWKIVSLAVLAAIGTIVAIRSLSPERRPAQGLRWIGAILIVILAVGLYLDLAFPFTGSLGERIDWRHGLQCVAKMVMLSVPAILALALLARRGAPTDRDGSALAAGIGAGSWGAFVFAFACPANDPLYIAIWYLVGCGAVALLARLILPRLMRW
jgi:hypothetical protein